MEIRRPTFFLRILPIEKKASEKRKEWRNPKMKIKSLREIEEIEDK